MRRRPVDGAPQRHRNDTAADSQFDLCIYLFSGPIKILINDYKGGKIIISLESFEKNIFLDSNIIAINYD